MTHRNQWRHMSPLNLKKGFRIHLIIFLLATPIIWLVWYLTDRTYLWPLWQTAGWSVGIIFHYLSVFVFNKSKDQ